jgi:hypothetical protein
LPAAGHGADDAQRLGALRDRVRQGRVGGVVREVAAVGEEADERPALAGDVIADGPAQRREPGLEAVEDGADGGRALNGNRDLALDLRQRAQVVRQDDPDHGRVWTSTDNTGGRSWTMAFQWSPLSAEA